MKSVVKFICLLQVGFVIFTWWRYWLAKYSLCCRNLSYNIHYLLLGIKWHQLAVTNEFTTPCTDIQLILYCSMGLLVCESQHWNSVESTQDFCSAGVVLESNNVDPSLASWMSGIDAALWTTLQSSALGSTHKKELLDPLSGTVFTFYLFDITHVTRSPRPSPSIYVFAECRWRYYWEDT